MSSDCFSFRVTLVIKFIHGSYVSVRRFPIPIRNHGIVKPGLVWCRMAICFQILHSLFYFIFGSKLTDMNHTLLNVGPSIISIDIDSICYSF